MNPEPGASPSDAPHVASGEALSKASTVLDLDNLKPGRRWRGMYQVGEQLPDVTYGRVFRALQVGSMSEVLIRAFKVTDDARSKAWESICRAQNGELLDPLEAVEAEGRRIEVVQAPSAVTLREWISKKAPTPSEITQIVKQLAEVVGCLHRNGVVHLNLRSDTLYIKSLDTGLSIMLGGFERAEVWRGVVRPAEISIDPYYSPPEAVGTFLFPRETRLRSWDWWSIGRVVQEMMLGRHILGHMLQRDVSRETPELRARAEALLKEENHMVRAGAVEMMPAMSPEMNALMRGLLTSSRDGRWGADEVSAWFRKEPVKDRYNLPKSERLFIWKEQAYTIAEAAEYFSQAAHWSEGLENLFEPTNAATLAYFIGRESAHSKVKERMDALLKLSEAPLLQLLPKEVVQDVIAAVVFKALAGSLAPLCFRGRKVDESFVREQLMPEAQPQGFVVARGLTARPVIQQIEQIDTETGRMLGEIERIYEGAATLARKYLWIPVIDSPQQPALMRVCMNSEPALHAVSAEMHKKYACSRDTNLDRLFKKPDPGYAELAVLAFTYADPVKFGYVTHREWNEEEYARLLKAGTQFSRAGTWLRLERALKIGPLVFGRFRLLAPFWLLVVLAVALVWQAIPAYLVAAACLIGVGFVRISWHGVHRQKLGELAPKERPWTLRSGPWHCRREASMALGTSRLPVLEEVEAKLRETNESIAKLTLEPAPRPVALPPHFKDTWLAAVVSWGVAALVCGATAWQAARHPPKMPDINFAVVTRLFSSGGSEDKPQFSLDAATAGKMKSMREELEELRRAKAKAGNHDVKTTWPFKAPSEGQFMRVVEMVPALPEQEKLAQEMAELLLDRYDSATVKDLVAIQVPVEKGVGLMLFNGRTGKMSGKKVYVVGFLPMPKSWIQLDANKAIFLSGL